VAESYAREIRIEGTAEAAYRALTLEFDKWWTASSQPLNAVGDTVTFRFDATYWTMRVAVLVPNETVELECVEAHHSHKGLPASIEKEWEGTRLRWDIEQQREKARISFLHEGLAPSLECYEICERGWDYFFVHSLKSYLETGLGSPYG